MKTLMLLTLSLFLSFQVFAGEVKSKMTVKSFVKTLDKRRADFLPSSVKNIPLKNLKINQHVATFHLNDIFFKIELVGKKDVVLKLNGKNFSKSDLASTRSIHQALRKKFGKKSQSFSILSLLFSKAYAAEEAFSQSTGKQETKINGLNFNFMSLLIKNTLTALSSILGGINHFMMNDPNFKAMNTAPDLMAIPQPVFKGSSY